MPVPRTAHSTAAAVCAMLIALGSAGCGGGVTSAPAGGPGSTASQKAVVTLSTSGSLAGGTAIGGLGITVDLPDTVTIGTTPGGNVDSGVVAASGVASGQATVLALYSGPTATARAKLHLVLASSSSGMPVGEFATITCGVRSGTNPTAADFSLNDFSAVDTSGASLSTLTVGLTETVQ